MDKVASNPAIAIQDSPNQLIPGEKNAHLTMTVALQLNAADLSKLKPTTLPQPQLHTLYQSVHQTTPQDTTAFQTACKPSTTNFQEPPTQAQLLQYALMLFSYKQSALCSHSLLYWPYSEENILIINSS